MRQTISFSIVREVQDAKQKKLKPREIVLAARKSLVNVAGLTYPNMQGSGRWIDFAEDAQRVVFTFDEREPTGTLSVESDYSVISTRTPLSEEAEGMVFLEALTYELVYFVEFCERLLSGVSQVGTFRLSLSLGGFDDAQVDWSGFSEEPSTEGRGMLLNWRFKGQEASFEVEGVGLPSNSKDDVNKAVQQIIGELSFRIQGTRHHPITGDKNDRLELTDSSIRSVIIAARSKIPIRVQTTEVVR